MASARQKAAIGSAMVLLGLVQAGSFWAADDRVVAALGLLYAAIGVGFLWAEVYRPDRRPEE
ncbi:hypothetical protein [Natrinema marinum]|uniref:hypothetical protein n=1 Tax=Natrinema marinum TaxID=2961598 RepID=UPI0020C91298|nr:hypothetical protein [Natrinema marinum]